MKIKRDKTRNILMPTRAHPTDAGLDIYSPDTFVLAPGQMSHRVNLGVAVEIPVGYVGSTCERSSQGAKGVSTKGNKVDSGYTGWIHVTLVNNGREDYEIKEGDRICQLVIERILDPEHIEEVDEFNETERSDSSHGSSGK